MADIRKIKLNGSIYNLRDTRLDAADNNGELQKLTDGRKQDSPLVGTTLNVTYSQLVSAIQDGRDIYITYNSPLYGPVTFTDGWVYNPNMGVVGANGVFNVGGKLLLGQLICSSTSKVGWSFVTSNLAKESDIPTVLSQLTNDSGFITLQDVPQSDWSESTTTSLSYIKNKPTNLSDFTNDENFITSDDIPQSDWEVATTTSVSYIKNKPPVWSGTGTSSVVLNNSNNIASGSYSFVEGVQQYGSQNTSAYDSTKFDRGATGNASHSEGQATSASYTASHAEGIHTIASGASAHAEGYHSEARGSQSHAEGSGNVANSASQHVFGEYNEVDTTGTSTTRGTYVEIVGNGTDSSRSNARTLDWNGNEILAGKLTVGSTATATNDVPTLGQVQQLIGSIAGIKFVVVADISSLPATGEEGTFYLVPKTGSTNDIYDEYIYYNNSYEKIGSTDVDLSQYVQKSELATSTQAAGDASISGSNFSFTGTAATLNVPSHSHSITKTLKYIHSDNAPKTFSTTEVAKGITTTSANAISSSTSKKLKTASLTPVGSTANAITAVSASTTADVRATAVTVLTGLGTPSTSAVVTGVTYTTASIRPAANVTALTTVTGTTATLASRVGSSVMNSATVTNGVLSFTSTSVSGNVVSGVTSSGQSVQGTAVTVATGASASGTTTVVRSYPGATTSIRPAAAVTAITALTTTSSAFAKAGTAVTYATGELVSADTTANVGGQVVSDVTGRSVITGVDVTGTTTAYTGVAATVPILSSITTTAGTGDQAFVSSLNENTGSTSATISYTPEGTIGGSQSIPAHTHGITTHTT